MMDLDKVLAFIESLNRHGVEYVLFGGLAMALHGLPRGTEDVDFLVRVTEENISRLQTATRDVWDDPEVARITYNDFAGDYPALRYGPPGETFTIDLFARFEGVEYDTVDSSTKELEGCAVRVVTPEALYAMKSGTGRHKDGVDTDWLRRKFSLGAT